MALDPETLKAISDAVKQALPEVITTVVQTAIAPINEQLEAQQHNSKKLSEAIASIPDQLNERFEAIKPSLEFIAEVKKEYEESENKSDNKPVAGDAIAKLRQEYEDKLNGFQQQLAERDTALQQREAAERQLKMRSEALDLMRGLGAIRPNTEKDLLTLLESRGMLIEDGDRYVVKGPDKFGEPTKLELKDILPKMLESDFAHFAVPRGGTGTDAAPSNNGNNGASKLKLDGMSAQDVYNNYNTKEGREALNAQLREQYAASR